MSKSAQSITSIDSRWLIELAHTWTDIEFVQEMLAQLPNIEEIKRELWGFDGGEA
jgi:hypothetical protein